MPSSTTVNLVRAERCPVSLPQGLDRPPLFIECVRLTRRAHSVGLRVNPSCVCVKSRFPGSLPCPRYPKKNNIFLMIQRIPIASFILDFRLSCQEFTLILPGSRPLKHPNVKAPMSGHTDVALREVQGIYQGLAPWAVIVSPPSASVRLQNVGVCLSGPDRSQ